MLKTVKANCIVGTGCSAAGFYGEQGRLGSHFVDRNEGLIAKLQVTVPDAVCLEMETGHLYHLAACTAPGQPIIHAAGLAVVLANRNSNAFLGNNEKVVLEGCAGRAGLNALAAAAKALL